LQLVRAGTEISPLKLLSGPASLPGFDRVKQAVRGRESRFSTKGATPLLSHPQLILPLPRQRLVRELVFDAPSACARHIPASFHRVKESNYRGDAVTRPCVTSSSSVLKPHLLLQIVV